MLRISSSLNLLKTRFIVILLIMFIPVCCANATLSTTTQITEPLTKSEWTSTQADKILISVKKVSKQHFSINAKMYVKADTKAFFALLESADKDCSWLASCKKVTILDKSLPQFRYVHTVFSS